MRAYLPLNRRALDAFDTLTTGGVDAKTREAKPFLACFATTEERDVLLSKFAHVQTAGQEVDYEILSGTEAAEVEPVLSPGVGAAVRLHRQRYIDPPAFLEALAGAVRDRGADIREGVTVTDIRERARTRPIPTSSPSASPG